MDETSLKQAKELSDQFKSAKNKEPYRINILDEIHADENAHSRILMKLVAAPDEESPEQKPLLDNFLDFLGTPFSNLLINNKRPIVFKNELYRIDILLKGEKFALIIENKIHGAVDQHRQIVDYIDKMKNEGYSMAQIYVLYLTGEKESFPSESSLPTPVRESMGDRFRSISYKNDVCEWTETICTETRKHLYATIHTLYEHLKLKYMIANSDNNLIVSEILKDKSTSIEGLKDELKKTNEWKSALENYLKDTMLDIIKDDADFAHLLKSNENGLGGVLIEIQDEVVNCYINEYSAGKFEYRVTGINNNLEDDSSIREFFKNNSLDYRESTGKDYAWAPKNYSITEIYDVYKAYTLRLLTTINEK